MKYRIHCQNVYLSLPLRFFPSMGRNDDDDDKDGDDDDDDDDKDDDKVGAITTTISSNGRLVRLNDSY